MLLFSVRGRYRKFKASRLLFISATVSLLLSFSIFIAFFLVLVPVENHAGIIENMGKYSHNAPAGFSFIKWLVSTWFLFSFKYHRFYHQRICVSRPLESIVKVLSLKITETVVSCDTKTKDNVFVKVIVSVLYKVVTEKLASAYYRLTDPRSQIQSYVFDVIRSSVPRLELDDAFASKADVADAVRTQLATLMSDFGYEIRDVLITDLEPDRMVKRAMNQINAEQRKREAASYNADAAKILQVKSAEADAESKYLSGLGVARQRKAVVDGLKESVTEFTSNVGGSTSSDVMDLLLVTQYFDTLRDVGKGTSANLNTMFLPHGPQAVSDLRKSLHTSFMANLTNVDSFTTT